MDNYFRNLHIISYRGISNLTINKLNAINLIVGDNNSGKTSLLEAIYLLRAPDSLNNVLRASRLRITASPLSANNLSLYESFVSIFPKNSEATGISIKADRSSGQLSLDITGKETLDIIESADFKDYPPSYRREKERDYIGTETVVFTGTLCSSVGVSQHEMPIRITPFSRFPASVAKNRLAANVVYLSPVSHITDDTFKNIVKSDNYKEICISLIRLFDPDVEDLLYMPNEMTGRATEYIKSAKLGLMPLVSYGDGIKKVLSLANAIIEASGGILLIDEIDTSIHYRVYSDIFRFLIKAAKKFNVQLFITTHSDEAIKEILKTQEYTLAQDSEEDMERTDMSAGFLDPITVITLRKNNSGNVRARSMSGFDVLSNQELFNFEVRL